MAKKSNIPSWDDMTAKPPTKGISNLPTIDELMFGRMVESRQGREQTTEQQTGWDVAIPKDVENVGTELTTAPTTNPARPRALTIGYNSTTNTLIVVFRDNTWWQYNNVPVDTWLSLRSSDSTGKFLREEGLDNWPDMGPANMDDLSEGVKAQIGMSAQTASTIQNGGTALEKVLRGDESLRSFSSEELFKDYL